MRHYRCRSTLKNVLTWLLLACHNFLLADAQTKSRACTISPLGQGRDDTDQVEGAIAQCGHFGTTVFQAGTYNITRKMTWNLVSSRVDLRGFLSFKPDIEFWLNSNNTFRVIFIQSQASWFVVTGRDFVIDAHNVGGIQGNGQPWWSFFATRTRADGDGRPVSLTLFRVTRGIVRNFRIESPPFWSNAIAESRNVLYDGMFVNATNGDPTFFGQNVVPNTDGIDTYRSDNIVMQNWDITCGDDCLAIKGNSSNIIARDITCRGGTGVAFGSLGQYSNMSDNVFNVLMENLKIFRINSTIQPFMTNGVYFKTWTGTVNGSPPDNGGGGTGLVQNVTIRNVQVDGADTPLHLFQTNKGHPGDAPSTLSFDNLRFSNWNGSSSTNKVVDIECSPAAACTQFAFRDFEVRAAPGQVPSFVCENVQGLSGLGVSCNDTG